MKQETFFYMQIKHALQDIFGEDMHYQRLESAITQGLPDINVCTRYGELWLEAKVGDYDLQPLQIAWMKKRQDAAGHCYAITSVGGRIVVSDRRFLHKNYYSMKDALRAIFKDAFGVDI